MNKNLYQKCENSLLDDELTCKKISFNLNKNKDQDNTDSLVKLTNEFKFEDCKDEYWNPEKYSLLYGTPIWDQSSKAQKIKLNQLYWVGYYSQIISAEIATIFLNQTSAAGLYGMEDFKEVCDTLDFESSQERTHIDAFKKISEQVEEKIFGERIFTYPMKNFATETMVFQDTNYIKEYWKKIQLHYFAYLSSSNAFIASQYLTVRGLRTLNGKIIQHELSQYYNQHPDQENAPIPSKISYHHFLDESYHFNSSTIIGHDVVKSLKQPTFFERKIANMAIRGCQIDHANFSVSVNGIFWYEPALFKKTYQILRSSIFNMPHDTAVNMLEKCFCEENQGVHEAYKTNKIAQESYREYLKNLDFLSEDNRDIIYMKNVSIKNYLTKNKLMFRKFKKRDGYEI